MIIMDDAYKLKDFGLIPLQDHVHPMTPEIYEKTMSIPGMAGVWDFGSELRRKTFDIPVGIVEYDLLTKQQKLNAFVAFLFDSFGKPREVKLSFEYEPDKFYKVKVNSMITPERMINAERFNLPFVANDPMKYATANQYDSDQDIYYGEVDEGDYYDNPKSFQWIYERHYGGINNYSSLNTDFVIEITGTVTNPSVTNLVTDQKLTLPSISNGKLEIDGKRFVVIKNGQDILTGSNYNFFNIQPGEVGFLFEGLNPKATVTYKWLHKFM